MSYRTLNAAEIVNTIVRLEQRIAERLPAPVVIEAVNDIEGLTANFSRKVWQKISILESYNASSARIGADDRATENGADGLGLSSQQL